MNAANAVPRQEGIEVIDRPAFQVRFDAVSGITELMIKAEIIFDEAAAHESRQVLEEMRPGVKHFLLVGSLGFFQVTKKVRKLGASKSFSSHLAAVACYSTNTSLILLGELYNKINKPVVSTKIFYSREAAEEWLFQQMKQPA